MEKTMVYTENLKILYTKLSSTELFTSTHEADLNLLKSPAQCAALNFAFGAFSELGLAHARSFFQEQPFSCIIASDDEQTQKLLLLNGYHEQATMPEMSLALNNYASMPSPNAITIVPVDDYHLFRLWCITLSKTIALPLPELIRYNEPLFLLAQGGVTLFLAFLHNDPAATCMSHIFDKTCCISTMTVTPEYRRNGLASALTRACLEHAKAAACEKAILLSTAMGRPLYEKIGFTTDRFLTIFARY